MIDFSAIAEEVTRNSFVLLFGVTVDFTPSSLVELDVFIDATWSTEGRAPGDDRWAADEGQWGIILAFGAYTGEVIRRRLGGVWTCAPGVHALKATVRIGAARHYLPIARMWKRMRDGSSAALHPFYELATGDVPAYDFQAERAEHAARAARVPAPDRHGMAARLRARAGPTPRLDDGGAPVPGTMLAACPKCARPSSPGRVACVYCGGALVVPATCKACGRKSAPRARACMYCRAPL